MRRSMVVSALVAVCLLVATVALADGGMTIASAPELPNGQTVSGSVARLDFWRLTVAAGDQLVLNYAALSSQSVRLCFLQPVVDDFTLQDAHCWQPGDLDYTQGNTKRQTSRVFASAGRWTLVVGNTNCVSGNVNVKCNYPIQYQLTAYVRRATHMTLTTPAFVVKHSARVVLSGKVLGATSGNVAIQTRQGGRYVNIGVAPIGAAGGFRYSLRPTKTGPVSYRAFYPGDSGHRPSSAAIRITVV